jgi:1-acyl-sn-glycerol-3-phosphate acyltransferase
MIATALAAACRLISGAAVRWHCDPNADVPRIYFGNHSSHLDFIVIWSALPARLRRFARPVAGRDYWEQGPVRRYLASHVFHAVLIERGHAGSDDALAVARASIQRMAEEMSDRNSLIVFPEGTRSLNGEVGPFKSGLYHLSRLRPDAELIPVHLENLNRILPKGETLPVPMLSRVVFGPPFHTSVDDEKHDFLAKARSALIQLKAIS